jgi:fructose-bisphosphate aldolase class II
VFVENPGEFDPRAYLKPAKEAMRKICAQRFTEFGAVGMASKIDAIHTSVMAKHYTAGALDPKIGKAASVAAE